MKKLQVPRLQINLIDANKALDDHYMSEEALAGYLTEQYEKLKEKSDKQTEKEWENIKAYKLKIQDYWSKRPVRIWSEATGTTSGGKSKKQKVSMVSKLPKSKTILPPMRSWMPLLSNNISVPDETDLVVIPLRDGSTRDDSEVDELLKEYENFGGETFPEREDDINHLATLANSAMEHFKTDNLDMIIQNISSCLPFAVSPNKLYEKAKTASVANSKKPTSDIDSSYAQPQSFEKTISSYQSLFCRRCFIYNCQIHGLPYELPKNENSNPLSVFNDPCGVDCYLVDPIIQKFKLGTSERTFEADDVWTGSDQSLFLVLHEMFGNNYCAIANGMQFKTCNQVCDFARKNNYFQPELFESDLQNDIIGKRKVPKKLLWKIHLKKMSLYPESVVHPYTECSHDGPCDNKCPCLGSNNFCEKYCKCSPRNCVNRFLGCKCAGFCNKNHCSCLLASRECDPDVCMCKLHEKNKDKVCKNVSIQQNLTKHLLLAPSDLCGWGIFSKLPIEKGEFISEYCGEMISQQEAEKRGKVYDHLGCSYLFDLNSCYSIDATRKGNKIRFANHSNHPNCFGRVMMVRGDHRIGIYAKKKINAGDELFFDYRYDPNWQSKLLSKERKLK